MNNTHTHTMDNQTNNSNRLAVTLTSLEQAVLADLINDATKSTGGEFTYAADAWSRGFSKAIMSRKSFAGAIGSLDKKGVISAGHEGAQITGADDQYLIESELAYLLTEVYGTQEVAEEVEAPVAQEVAEEVAEVELLECTPEQLAKLEAIRELELEIIERQAKVAALKRELHEDNNPEPPKGGGSPKPDAPRDFVIEVTNEKLYKEADYEKVEIVPNRYPYVGGDTNDKSLLVLLTYVDMGSRGSFIVDASTAQGIGELAKIGLAVVPAPDSPKGGGSPKPVDTDQGKLNPSLYPLVDLHNYYWTRKANYFNPTNERYKAIASIEEAYPEFASLTFADIEAILWSNPL